MLLGGEITHQVSDEVIAQLLFVERKTQT
jgi:hypothetical protein